VTLGRRPAGRHGRGPVDADDLKQLFHRLHLYNAGLDPRFALAEGWERHVEDLAGHASATLPRLALLARQDDQPAGFVLAGPSGRPAVVPPRMGRGPGPQRVGHPWRSSGLADTLLGQALAWAAERGLPVVQLCVAAGNVRALRFYERNGFCMAQAILRAVLSNGSAGPAQPAAV
jgi:ribosomal protein S18 acetylase RimI-like enzyme